MIYEEWNADSACGPKDLELFYAHEPARQEEAKAMCATCPVKVECLEFALRTRQADGIWGGLTELERADLLGRKRGSRGFHVEPEHGTHAGYKAAPSARPAGV